MCIENIYMHLNPCMLHMLYIQYTHVRRQLIHVCAYVHDKHILHFIYTCASKTYICMQICACFTCSTYNIRMRVENVYMYVHMCVWHILYISHTRVRRTLRYVCESMYSTHVLHTIYECASRTYTCTCICTYYTCWDVYACSIYISYSHYMYIHYMHILRIYITYYIHKICIVYTYHTHIICIRLV